MAIDKVLKYGTTASSPLYTTGFKNKIVNGAMQIAQRATTSTAQTATGVRTADRWTHSFVSPGSGQYSSTQNTNFSISSNNYYSLNMTTTTGATIGTGTSISIQHNIEATSVVGFMGQTIVISFWCKVSTAGTYTVAIRNSATTASYVTSFLIGTANSPTYITIPVVLTSSFGAVTPGTGTGMILDFLGNAGSTFQAPALNSWQTGNYTSHSSATVWANTSSNYIEITQVQVEIGQTATAFEWRDCGIELFLCQRDFQYVTTWTGQATGTTIFGLLAKFTPIMRATPTITKVSNALSYMIGITPGTTVAGSWTYTAISSGISISAFVGNIGGNSGLSSGPICDSGTGTIIFSAATGN